MTTNSRDFFAILFDDNDLWSPLHNRSVSLQEPASAVHVFNLKAAIIFKGLISSDYAELNNKLKLYSRNSSVCCCQGIYLGGAVDATMLNTTNATPYYK